MKIDKSKLNALASLQDRELWATVVAIASSHGIKIPDNPPPESEMKKLREAISGAERINMMDAMRIVKNYKRGS